MLHATRVILRAVTLCTALACSGTVAAEEAAAGALASYVARSDTSFAWREVAAGRIGSTEYIELLMTSQTWREVPWKHQLYLIRPTNMKPGTRQALLFVHGGRWKNEYETRPARTDLPREARLFARLANILGAPVGVLRQVPYQPLFERKEDALIAYTFDRYLQTGEQDWPLLLPMVKSAVRAMDVMQESAQQRWAVAIDSFTVTGASKRGWTSWLTAAIDPRVIGIAPMVIDVLNMQAQLAHQRATWGDVSEQIRDYSDLDLPARLRSQEGRELLSIVDPYSYRQRLTKPKLLLLSTNDRYWPLDALKLYWDGLPEPKNVLYVPNQGHSLRDVERVINSIAALHRHAASGEPLPQLSWKFTPAARNLAVKVNAGRSMRSVTAWTAYSPTRDFRSARWTSHRCARSGDARICRTQRTPAGYTATFAEVSFKEKRGPAFSLSTTVCLAGPPSVEPLPDC